MFCCQSLSVKLYVAMVFFSVTPHTFEGTMRNIYLLINSHINTGESFMLRPLLHLLFNNKPF